MADEIPVPVSAPNPLYPDGGNNPAGHPEAAVNPETGQPKYTNQTASVPAPESAPVEAVPAPAEAKVEVAKAETVETKPDVSAYKDLKLADGFQLDAPSMTSFQEIAAEAGVKPEAAQKLLDLYQQVAKSTVESLQTAITAETRKTFDTWSNQTKALPEFQGEAGERNLSALGALMDEYGTAEVRQAFDVTGAGHNPAIAKFLLSIGQALMEGRPTPNGLPGSLASPNGRPKPTSAGGILYPDLHASQRT